MKKNSVLKVKVAFFLLLLHLVYDILSMVCCCFVTLVKFSEAHKKVTIRFVCWNEGEKKKKQPSNCVLLHARVEKSFASFHANERWRREKVDGAV